jgi:hypothetical protein
MNSIPIRLLSVFLLLVSVSTSIISESSFSYYSLATVIGMLLANGLAIVGAVYLWKLSKAAYPLWLVGYSGSILPILLLPKNDALSPDQPWIWIALPVLVGIVVIANWRQLKWQ